MLSKDDADRAIADLSAARDRIAAQMYAIDTHPAWGRLRGGALTGQTAGRATVLAPQVDRLWASFGALREALERAAGLRGAGRPGDQGWDELSTLFAGAAVGLDADGMPVDGTGVAVHTVTLAQLSGATEQQCAVTLSDLSDVDAAWSAVTTEFGRCSAAVAEVTSLAAGLGAPQAADPLRVAASEIERLDLADPVAAAPGGRLSAETQRRCTALAASAEATRDRLAELVRARDRYPERRAALAALLDDLAAAQTALAEAHRRVEAKIAEPGLTPVPAAETVLRGRLADLDRLERTAQWQRLSADLSTMESSVTRALARAAELRAAADGLLDRRAELRGRLEAYRAKAGALGYAEDATLAAAFDKAHQLLFTAPCDLRAATRAVHAYQSALAGRTGRPERSPVDDRRL